MQELPVIFPKTALLLISGLLIQVFALGEWKPAQQRAWLETDSPISKFFLLESLKGADIEDGISIMETSKAYPL